MRLTSGDVLSFDGVVMQTAIISNMAYEKVSLIVRVVQDISKLILRDTNVLNVFYLFSCFIGHTLCMCF